MKRLLLLPLGLLAFTLTACGAPPQPTDILVRVAGEPIAVEDLIQAMKREGHKFGPEVEKNSKRFQKMKETLLEDLIQKKILAKEALKQGLAVTEEDLEKETRKFKSRYTEKDFQDILKKRGIDYPTWREIKRVNLLTDRLIQEKLFANIQIPEEAIRGYYDEHQQEFTQPEAVRVRQIVTETRGAAEAILKKLKEGENFARLARDLSISPDRLKGGDVGYVTRGNFPKEFEACFDLKVGELSPVVPSLYGFHIFKVIEKRAEKLLPFEELKDQIEEWLKENMRDEAFRSYYQDLRKKYAVEINSKILKKVQWKSPPLLEDEK